MAGRTKAPSKKRIKQPNKQTRRVTPKHFEKFINAIRETANITKACELAGITRDTFYKRKRNDSEWRLVFEQAWKDGYEALEAMCAERAFNGYDRPVYQNGEKVGIMRQYSDSLAAFLLKGNRPDKFIDRSIVTNKNGDEANPYDEVDTEELRAELKRRMMKGTK